MNEVKTQYSFKNLYMQTSENLSVCTESNGKRFSRLWETRLCGCIWELIPNIQNEILFRLASPRWRLELRDAVVNRPNTLRLSCEVVGPTPTFQWEKDSKTLTATERMKITQESQRSTLEITNSAFEDSGVYTCTAVNDHGHVTTSCIAQVRGNLNILRYLL